MKPLSVICLFTIVSKIACNPTFVKTTSGPIQGFISELNDKAVKAFLGIPFAQPPVADLRFKKPKPVQPWTDTLQATEMPPACIQYTEYPFPWYDGMPGKSEDCLYLNIYTPIIATEGDKLPVMFWIYGGGFTLGSSRLDLHDPRALVQEGDVIVVTFNYRVGLFGFLTSNTEDAPGNVGVHDMVMALQWVNDNIEYFGGDKERITVFGESAGSIAISLFCVSPLTKGLFSKAIMESGSAILMNNNYLQPNLQVSQRLAKAVDCASDYNTIEDDPDGVVGCLREQNATYLAYVLWSLDPTSIAAFFPQYGDELLPNNAVDDIREGSFTNAVPILIGNNKDEGSFLITTQNLEIFGFFGYKDPEINKTYAESMLLKIFSNFTDPQKYVNYYLDGVPDDDYDLIRRQVYTAAGDIMFLCETVYFAESYAERNNDVYFYFFTHRPSNSPWTPWMGVAHFEEIQFVFGRPVRKPDSYQKNEASLSTKMMRIWSNFAKYGHPGEFLKWPKYSKANPTYMNIDVNPRINEAKLGTGPHLENCNVIRSHYGF